jgi:hypothetical protein
MQADRTGLRGAFQPQLNFLLFAHFLTRLNGLFTMFHERLRLKADDPMAIPDDPGSACARKPEKDNRIEGTGRIGGCDALPRIIKRVEP